MCRADGVKAVFPITYVFLEVVECIEFKTQSI